MTHEADNSNTKPKVINTLPPNVTNWLPVDKPGVKEKQEHAKKRAKSQTGSDPISISGGMSMV
ncbi:hypothetical protein ACFS07_25205 [Undibacterium arcticum]